MQRGAGPKDIPNYWQDHLIAVRCYGEVLCMHTYVCECLPGPISTNIFCICGEVCCGHVLECVVVMY